MLTPSGRAYRRRILLAAAMLMAGMSISFAQGGGASGGGAGGASGGGAGGATAGTGGAAGAAGAATVSPSPSPSSSRSPSVVNPSSPNTVPQQSYAPLTPSRSTTASTPGSAAGGDVKSSPNEEQSGTSAQSERMRAAKTRPIHHRRGRFAERMRSYYCGSSPCVRINVPAFYGYARQTNGVVRPAAVYASTLWWPGYYDYAPGQFGRGHPRYGGYWRRGGQAD